MKRHLSTTFLLAGLLAASPGFAAPRGAPLNNAPLKSMTKAEPNASPGLSE